MGFQLEVETAALKRQAQSLATVVRKKSFPKAALMDWDEHELRCFGSNGDEVIQTRLIHTGAVKGTVVFDPNHLVTLLKKFRSHTISLEESKDNRLLINGKYRMTAGWDLENFQNRQELTADLQTLESLLVEKLGKISFAITKESYRNNLHQVVFRDGKVVASDGSMVAMVDTKFEKPFAIMPFSVKALTTIGKLYDLYEMAISKNMSGFKFKKKDLGADEVLTEEVFYFARVPTVEFPDLSFLLEQEEVGGFTAKKEDIDRAIGLMLPFNDIAEVELKENRVTFIVEEPDKGSGEASLKVVDAFGAFKYGLDMKRLMFVTKASTDIMKFTAYGNFMKIDSDIADNYKQTFLQAKNVRYGDVEEPEEAEEEVEDYDGADEEPDPDES